MEKSLLQVKRRSFQTKNHDLPAPAAILLRKNPFLRRKNRTLPVKNTVLQGKRPALRLGSGFSGGEGDSDRKRTDGVRRAWGRMKRSVGTDGVRRDIVPAVVADEKEKTIGTDDDRDRSRVGSER